VPDLAEITLAEAARQAGVSPATLKRWGADGIIPDYRGRWTRAAAAHARIVARLREQGHSLDDIKEAGEDGRLAFGYVEELFPARDHRYNLAQAAKETGLEEALIERLWRSMGFPSWMLDHLGEEDLEALRYMAAVLEAGFPLVAFLQVLHVYGQALRQIADAEARLFRIYVHEPLIQDGVPSTEMSEEMGELISEILPQTTPLMVYLHRSFLRHSVEQDVIANMWSDLLDNGGEALGQLRVGIVFADLVGFVRFTEEEGEEEALDLVESFVTSVEESLPGSARVVKNIGDGVMIVGTDPVALTDWAIGFQEGFERRSRPRIGIHYGRTVYRDGDYFGGNVNLASRVVARAHAGEVLVTDTVVEAAGERTDLEFEPIGEVQLKGFKEPTELYLAREPQAA
jgi:adenylate cyclase